MRICTFVENVKAVFVNVTGMNWVIHKIPRVSQVDSKRF